MEQIFADAFDGFEKKPSEKVWSGINRKMMFKRFFRFNIQHFNVFYVGAIIAILALLQGMPQNEPQRAQTVFLQPANNTLNYRQTNNTTIATPHHNNITDNTKTVTTKKPNQVQNQQNNKLINQNTLAENTPDITITQPDLVLHNATPVKMLMVNASASVNKGCANLKVDFNNHSKNAKQYLWNFGDGNTSSLETPTHTYTKAGTYKVLLTAIGEFEKIQTTVAQIEVYETPRAKIQLLNRSVQPNRTLLIKNFSENAENYRWNFGDGSIADVHTPKYKYRNAGIYTISLKVWTNNQCADSTALDNIIVEPAKHYIVFPNAFLANTIGPANEYYSDPKNVQNQLFIPQQTGVLNYQLSIYNRHGLRIFYTDELLKGWNGYYKQELMAEGVYVWHVKGTFEDGQTFAKSGSLTLIHKTQ